MRLSKIKIHPHELNFSAGHFTIFSATHREKLHGHNYSIALSLTTLIDKSEGITFDYRDYKRKLKAICDQLNLMTILPLHSKYLQIIEKDGYVQVNFDNEVLTFPRADVILLPISNTTVEELSHWILQQLLSDKTSMEQHRIQKMVVTVYSSLYRSGSAKWKIIQP